MEESIELECTDATSLLRDLFDSKIIIIKEDPKQLSMCKSILEAMQKNNSLQSNRCLSKEDVLKKDIPSYPVSVEPGTVYFFEVDVINDKSRLRVTERDSSKRTNFLQLDESIDAVRVIWIYSKSVRVIDAKLCVYKEYEPHIISRNLLLHHEYDGYAEISKHRRIQKLQSLIKLITRIKDSIPQDSLRAILEKAMEKVFSFENIKQVCFRVHLQDGDDDIGTVESRRYCCYSFITVQRIKRNLVEKTLGGLARSVGSEIVQRILQHIEGEIRQLEHKFPELRLNISVVDFIVFTESLSFYIAILLSPTIAIVLAIVIVLTLLFSVDINDRDWRGNVAKEIHNAVWEKKYIIINDFLPKIRDICKRTIADLNEVCEQIERHKRRTVVSNQRELVNEWKNRNGFCSRADPCELAKYHSFVTLIAGRRDDEPVVKVFLQHDDENAKAFFKQNCDFPPKFVNVTSKLKKNADREKQENAVESIDSSTKHLLRNVLELEGEKMMANHSTIVCVGISRVDHVGEPCIAVYCLDKNIIPFGEQQIPKNLKGFPVDCRED